MNSERVKVHGTTQKPAQHNKLTRRILALAIGGLMTNVALAQTDADTTQGSIGDTMAPEFQQLDQNSDSRLEWSDVRTVLEPRLSAANMDPRSTFDQYDEDNDNALSEQEFDSLISAIDDAELSSQGTASTDYGTSSAASDTSQSVGGTALPNDNIGSTTGELDSENPGVADAAGNPTDGAIVTTDQDGSAVGDPATDPEAYEELSGSQSNTTDSGSDQAEDSLIEQPASYDSEEASDQPSDYEDGTLQEEPARFEGSGINGSEADNGVANSSSLDSSESSVNAAESGTAVSGPVSEPVGNGTAPADHGSDVAATSSTTGIEDTVNSSAGGEFTTEQPASYDESAVTGVGNSADQTLEEPINQSPISQANIDSTPAELRKLPIADIQDKAVRNSKGDKIGDVNDLVVNRDDGRIGFVVSAGGVMGIGSKKLLAPVEELSLRGEDLVWETEKSKSELKDSDRYNSDNFVVISDQYQTLDDLNQGGLSNR